ncbi:uncharacterized protein LOC112023555 [Quercus suber]|uniref:uncharacterized protein LOC112023555 n=1 Tax=Quercus suber TaxID=58331 RepID=UPI0032E01EA2
MAGQGEQQAESRASQHVDHFANLERRQNREGSVHTVRLSQGQSQSGSHMSHAKKNRDLQLEIDLHNDISGLLSAHPQTTFVSLHHIDTIDPIFPSMNRSESINRLLKAAKVDQSRLLQQTIRYHRQSNWSLSISATLAYINENIIPRSILWRPIETFRPWHSNSRRPFYMFNTRWPSNNPCEAPHLFFFDSIEHIGDQIVTTYVRRSPRGLPACSSTGNHSTNPITRIKVFSPASTHLEVGGRHCCDIVYKA